MRKLISLLSGFFLALSVPSAFAGTCPNGSFNPNNNVCMCPNGGYVGPGEWCAQSSPEYVRIKNWSSYSNALPRSVREIVADAKSQGYDFTKDGYIYLLPTSFLDNKARRQYLANDNGKQGLINAGHPAKVHRLQAEYTAAVQQAKNPPASNNTSANKTNGNWEISQAKSYVALISNEKSSLTPNQEKQNAYLSVMCKNNNLMVTFVWLSPMFPSSYNTKDIEVLLQWDTASPQEIALSGRELALILPNEQNTSFISKLGKHRTLTLRIRDSKNKWNLTNTFNLNGASEAITVPINACKK